MHSSCNKMFSSCISKKSSTCKLIYVTCSTGNQPSFHLSFFLSLWKLNFINWLEFRPRSVAWRGCWNGIRGLFVGKHVSERLLLLTTGEDTFVFSFLGTSSLSNILEVFISSCLLLSAEDKTNVTVLALEIQGEECILGTSQMTSCSHSSARHLFCLYNIQIEFISLLVQWFSAILMCGRPYLQGNSSNFCEF